MVTDVCFFFYYIDLIFVGHVLGVPFFLGSTLRMPEHFYHPPQIQVPEYKSHYYETRSERRVASGGVLKTNAGVC